MKRVLTKSVLYILILLPLLLAAGCAQSAPAPAAPAGDAGSMIGSGGSADKSARPAATAAVEEIQPVEQVVSTPAAPALRTALPAQGSKPATASAATSAARRPPAASAPLKLQVTSPADQTTVNAPQLVVTGVTAPGAVVSVNDALADVDAAGNFKANLTLDEGPNVIEVVASDIAGNQLNSTLLVIYEP